jgi:hypothetical protein
MLRRASSRLAHSEIRMIAPAILKSKNVFSERVSIFRSVRFCIYTVDTMEHSERKLKVLPRMCALLYLPDIYNGTQCVNFKHILRRITITEPYSGTSSDANDGIRLTRFVTA